jgi:8-oxo-dGTP diphosphatase
VSSNNGPGDGYRHPGDGWVDCPWGHRHWGLHGAAGLLVVRFDGDAPAAVILQHRSPWSHQGSTWSIPGGAAMPGETRLAAALREATEEAGIGPAQVRPFARYLLEHPDWSYTTVVAEAIGDWDPTETDTESLEVTWVPVDVVPTMDLHEAFAAGWPALLRLATVQRDATWTEERP